MELIIRNMTEERINAIIQAALFRAATEYSNYFNESFKRKPKQQFKHWQNLGYEVIRNLNLDNEPIIDALTEGIENCVAELKQGLIEILEKEKIT
jgi:stalled ribosome alternative rescue factor ArfA